jgi:hypothetical protein
LKDVCADFDTFAHEGVLKIILVYTTVTTGLGLNIYEWQPVDVLEGMPELV